MYKYKYTQHKSIVHFIVFDIRINVDRYVRSLLRLRAASFMFYCFSLVIVSI